MNLDIPCGVLALFDELGMLSLGMLIMRSMRNLA